MTTTLTAALARRNAVLDGLTDEQLAGPLPAFERADLPLTRVPHEPGRQVDAASFRCRAWCRSWPSSAATRWSRPPRSGGRACACASTPRRCSPSSPATACNRVHPVQQGAARWLLSTADRLPAHACDCHDVIRRVFDDLRP